MRKNKIFIPRRQLIRGLIATATFGVSAQLWTGCSNNADRPVSSSSEPDPPNPESESPTDRTTIGFIYVGSKDDFGYNQAHSIGAQSLTAIANLQIVEEANVPETNAVAETMRSMIELDRANAIFPTSFGYFDPYIVELASEFNQVQFFHFGSLFQAGVHPDNIGTYFSYIDEAQYLAGIAAAHVATGGKLGFVAAKPIPLVLRNINSFTLGARSINPDATVQVVFTGNWSEPIKEAEATNSLVDQGIELVTCHVDSPKAVVETAEKRGILICGYHTDQAALAPNGYVTGAIWDWTNIYTNYAEMILAGQSVIDGSIPRTMSGGLAEGFCDLAPYGAMVDSVAQQAVEQARAELIAGDRLIYAGEIRSNQGEVLIAADTQMQRDDPALVKMDWLVEGVIGSPSS
ncbi:nucleoside-binding protein [Thalassoporum mexicanum PCC 7367]|uniref:BMP family ABC transporter substrate-binding protein n=1 Tax=Thalassoporum mexicanum TaxID=3457544 RepID=UPI00029F9627|nr:BMP family ABC transporter substrate-binding protein [Pseudanabaena sp. PCC 7367]AFY69895.1 nucleoside-binding protein [Pseudanabaena sp. PCC 7367]